MKKLIASLVFCTIGTLAAWSQARPTASRAGDLQIGGSFSSANPDYGTRMKGFGFYSDFDFREHLGVEVDFHQVHHTNGDPNIDQDPDTYERSYEVGARYFRTYNRFKPYIRAMYGRGVFNFPYNEANLAYNQIDGAAGVDIGIISRVNARVEYEYQDWFGFPPNGLQPNMVTFGVAYHFPAGKPKKIY